MSKERNVRTLDEYMRYDVREKVKSIVESFPSEDRLRSTKVEKALRSWTMGEVVNNNEEVEGYLLDVRYDGRLNRAVAFIVREDGRMARWIDRTDHRPYFLTSATPEDLQRLGLSSEDSERILQMDIVSKFHSIRREKVRLTKIIVNDPLAVRRLRSILGDKGFKFWEADIRYHHNYIFDNLLVPGMRYRAGKRMERVGWDIDPTFLSSVMSITAGESKEYSDMAKELAFLFEQRPPRVKRAAIDVEVYTPEAGKVPDPAKAPYPVVSIALADNEGRVKVLALYREKVKLGGEIPKEVTEVEIFDSERAMLLELMRELERYPVVLTFNGDAFDLPYLYNRMLSLGIEDLYIPIEVHEDMITFRHSLHVDLHKFFSIKALQVYAFGGSYRELRLDSVAEVLLGVGKVKLDEIVSRVSLSKLIEYNARDAMITRDLTTFSNDLVWNLIIMVMRISKLGLEDVTRHQVSAWIRGLMNWEHRRRGWLIPSREELSAGEARSRAMIKDKRYRGAIVLNPPTGLFFNVAVLDYASLYPSIVKNWNLSYETIENPRCGERKKIPEVGYEVCTDIRGITSEIVGLLREFRVKIYKKRAKDSSLPEEQRRWYDTVQSALKVYINASYGVFGNEAFPFYSLPVAESVTAIGRTVLTDTLRVASERSLYIIYGDTDSIFVWDPKKEDLEFLVKYVADMYGLELELDKKFKVVLFGGLKKNYIGVTEKGEVVIKGMVGKKSSTPEFIKNEFKKVVQVLGELEDPESAYRVLEKIRERLLEMYKKVKNRGYTLDELAIRVMLSKDPEKYKKTTPQHVKAARMLQAEGINVTRGNIISYVKTKDSVGVKPVSLAKLSEVDVSKYVEHMRTTFEQMLESFGLEWEEITGQRSLDKILGSHE
ncbi:MAG: DNA-directed DNA polymerase I [Acidilobaceae archaeon]|nr:DNA-directed DNA polymerase I [Acidilobaceae archaeon]MCX8165039.1 DNA-directed DNA polymerase I [Acidilobaceae archaeon]MDW7974444.1 DNA-directed DNA polymerase I [Sulfolobales archaeon]